MTVRQRRRKSLRVNLLPLIAKQLGDLRGPSSLAYELIQNADDAKDDSLKLSATRIEFDVTDDALVVSNDAVFRNEDFERISVLASGTKLNEGGDRTTGAFGVGFISVYQVTDRPQIYSASQHWTLMPEEEPDQIEICDIKICDHSSFINDKGTKFYFPWAIKKSKLRDELESPPITKEYIESFIEELKVALPHAILFLKSLKEITLLRKGKVVTKVKRIIQEDDWVVHSGNGRNSWHMFRDTDSLRTFKDTDSYYSNRLTKVRVAIPESFIDNGILFATLPTKQSTGLPFHIDADFFPTSDRKSIRFEDEHDPKSEWNREAMRVAALLVRDSLGLLLEKFNDNFVDFWAILKGIYDLREVKHDAPMSLGVFWEVLEPVLKTHPIIYTESKRWLKAIEVRIPVSKEEQNTIDVFNFLDIEMVNRDLLSYYNILTNNGVRLLGIKDIYEALEERDMIAHPQSISFYQNYERLELLWRGILAIYHRTTGQQDETKSLLGKCVIAPAVDGRIWPCDSVYRVEDKDTLRLFSCLLPNNCSFLDLDKVGEGDSLFELLCPSFSPTEAVEVLEALELEEFRNRLSSRGIQLEDIVRWFSRREIDEDDALSERFVKLEIFPTGKDQIASLEDIWIPGGFDDPLEVAQLLDMQKLKGLSDFLRKLGAEKLTFIDYAKCYITKAFDSNSTVDSETKYKLLELLEKRFGEIREDEELKDLLINTNIIECSDGDFRSPRKVYFPDEEIEEVLGSRVSYCKLPTKPEGRRDLYEWLGVAEQPRVVDILDVIDRLTDESPDQRTRKSVIGCLKAVAKTWEDFSDDEREGLKNKSWLPAKDLSYQWYKPEELYTAEDKRLFESQAYFLDTTIQIQNELSTVLRELGIKSRPQPKQVIRHLLRCSQDDIDPPEGIYKWLDERVAKIPSHVLDILRDRACLWSEGKYRRPDQVFLQHDFRRFRFQPDDNMRSNFKLLKMLVKDRPGHDDAIELLKDIAHEVGNNKLDPEDKAVIHQCWVLISKALDQEELCEDTIKEELHNVLCVPDNDDALTEPVRIYFEDRPRLKDKFQLLGNNCIQRTEGIWKGMQAAGVRPLSSAIRGEMNRKDVHIIEKLCMRDHFMQMRGLIATILEEYFDYKRDSLINDVRFFLADEFKVTWKLYAFNGYEESIDVESAYFDYEEKAIYYTSDHFDNTPWSAIARELSYALVRGDRVVSISPGIKVCLEATTYDEARMQLEDLGIALTQELKDLPSQAEGVTFDEISDDVPTDKPTEEDSLEEDDMRDGATGSNTSRSVARVGNQGNPFAKKFYRPTQRTSQPEAIDHPVSFPLAGPLTEESAIKDTNISAQSGRSGAYIERLSTRWKPTVVATGLARKFRDEVDSDYGKRCQICGSTFSTTADQLQVYIVHVVPPREDHRTNHSGNLLGLCGWHYSLVRYNGCWEFLNIVNKQPKQPFDDWEHMRDYVLKAEPDVDDEGNSYFSLGIRFPNVYPQWSSQPTPEDAVIKYSEPHWKCLRRLLSS